MASVKLKKLSTLAQLISHDDKQLSSLLRGKRRPSDMTDMRRVKRYMVIVSRMDARRSQYALTLTGGDFDKWSLIAEVNREMIDFGRSSQVIHIRPNIPGVKNEYGYVQPSDELLCKDKKAYQELVSGLGVLDGYIRMINQKNIGLHQVTCQDCLAKI